MRATESVLIVVNGSGSNVVGGSGPSVGGVSVGQLCEAA